MKPSIISSALTILILLSGMSMAQAQAPSSIAGDGFSMGITGGVAPFASYGYFIFITADSGSSYQTVGIYNVLDSSGTYTYTRTASATASISLNDAVAGLVSVGATFATTNSGTFYVTANSLPGAYQRANFGLATGGAPSSLVGKAFIGTVIDGASPFASKGSFTFRAAGSGNGYVTTGDGVWTGNSSGTYSYSKVNRSTGKLQMTDSGSGVSSLYVGFTDAWSGGYAVTQPSTGGFQVGNFVVLDTTRPTVSITNPPSVVAYTNSQTVSIGASASDDVGVTRVEFYDGSTLKGTATTSAYSYDWSFTDANNGAHAWTARAYDAAGNASTSSVVTLTVSIDITPPTVAISSPANGANLTTATTTVSGTASDPGSPTSGLSKVEVRLNGGSWSNATGTASWTQNVTLVPCGNTIEARSRDAAGNYSTIASNLVTYTPANTPPNTPINLLPVAGTKDVSLTPTLQASPFSDPDPPCVGDTHAASQWQVWSSSGGVVVADSGTDAVHKVSWTVPAGKLYYGSNYQWQVRYSDSRNGWSAYSTRTFFTNASPPLAGVRLGTNIVLNWPTNSAGFTLQWSTNILSVNWSNATPAPVVANGQYAVTNNMTNKLQAYRLAK